MPQMEVLFDRNTNSTYITVLWQVFSNACFTSSQENSVTVPNNMLFKLTHKIL